MNIVLFCLLQEPRWKVVDVRLYAPTNDELLFDNDFAVITVDREMVFSDRLFPVCLPHRDDGSDVGVRGQISGWGSLTAERPLQFPRVVHAATVTTFSKEECGSVPKKFLTDNMICASGIEGQDTCQGDSGGETRWFLCVCLVDVIVQHIGIIKIRI